MGKNKTKNGKSKTIEFPVGGMFPTGDDEFIRMKPTKKGIRNLEKVKTRRSKISGMAALEDVIIKPAYDPTKMSAMLDEIEDFVKDGKYGKALAAKKEDVLQEFLDAFSECGQTTELDKQLYGMAKKLITLGKSFYEYDEQQRELFDNISYDRLLAKYLKAGNQEPVGIIPKGQKNLKKTDITYPLLHNNMDKAYVLHKDDDVPSGVKETDSVEAFLLRSYKELDMNLTEDLSLELSPKIDGVSLNGTVHDDMLINPQTRGDKDESIAVMGLNGIQVATGFKAESDFGIQYEVFVTEEDRVKVSEYLRLARPYVSSRHAASGIIHRLSTLEDDDLLQFVSLYPINTENLDGTYEERMDYIQNFGIVPEDMIKRKIIKGDFDELMKQIEEAFDELKSIRGELSYPIDGMVITIANDHHQEVIGRDGRTNKYQLAMKFNPANAEGYVQGLTLTTGRKGYRTIQIELDEPVFLDGVRYDHIPVLSANLFDTMDLRLGSKVSIHRVGDVIPSISVIRSGNGKKLTIPYKCPDCGEFLEIKNKKIYCANPICPGNIIGRFIGFFNGMDLDGYSDSAAEILYHDLNCRSISDILKLSKEDFKEAKVKSDSLQKLPELLKDAITKHYDFEVLGAFGLPGIGKERAKMILSSFAFSKLHEITGKDATEMSIASIAFVSGKSDSRMLLKHALKNPVVQKDLKVLAKYVTKTRSKEKMIRVGHTGGNLNPEVKDCCRANGFEVVDGKSFDILITKDPTSESEKMNIAHVKNLPIYDEDSFLSYYGEE